LPGGLIFDTRAAVSSSKLSPKQRRHLSGLGHTLQPIVVVGKEGVTDGVVAALEQALLDHELVKVRVGNSATEDRKDVGNELAKRTEADLVSVVGKTMLIYKAHPEKPKIKLPKQ
jgi:RNA-binding protein